jgi:serine/threonine protein kinase
MPDRLSYDEAMLYSQHCLKIQEPDLKLGNVETYAIKTAVGELKKPWGIEGGFAVVYKFRTQSGQMKAMRCFRVAMNPDTQFRYEKMSSYFRQHVPDITIDFRYYEDGILVKETVQSSQKKVCPVIVMEWIDGVTLLEKVDELCMNRDTHALGQLAERWLDLVNKLYQAHMAHGDLAGVNVMVRKNGQLVLVDYDGVYIPEFAGFPQVVLGQQGYQHPDMTHRPFNEHTDGFSALVIYLSLLALQAQPELWDKYVQRNSRGQLDGNMLFTRDDFMVPNTSPIFADMLRISDAEVRDLTRILQDTCNKLVLLVRFPPRLLDPDYQNKQALKLLEQAILQGDDEQIIKLWAAPLAAYGPAQCHQPRVIEARERVAVLAAFNNALATHDVFKIADALTPEIIASNRIGATEREIGRLAAAFAQAYRCDDENQMIGLWQEIQKSRYGARLTIGEQERNRLKLVEQRRAALTKFRIACYQNSRMAHIIVSAYSPILDGNSILSKQERELLDVARRYVTMYNTIRRALQMNNGQRNITQFLAAYDEELDKRFDDFMPEERKQITTLSNYGKLERALTGNASRLALVTARDIEMETRTIITDDRLSKARENFIKAYEAKNLQVQVRYGQAYASWDWPNDELIQLAVVVWRYDRWPQHPQTPDPGRELRWVNRGVYEVYRYFQFPVSMARELYVQVYFAITGFVGQTNETFYSRGNEPTSKWLG